jgi:cell division protein FtsB
MTKIITALRRLKYTIRHDYLTLNNVVLGLAFVCCLGFVLAAIATMTRNWGLEQNLESRRRDLDHLRAEVAILEYEKIYYASEEYQELSARTKQNKILPGETMLILPPNSESAIAKHQSAPTSSNSSEESAPSPFEQWLHFLFDPKN